MGGREGEEAIQRSVVREVDQVWQVWQGIRCGKVYKNKGGFGFAPEDDAQSGRRERVRELLVLDYGGELQLH